MGPTFSNEIHSDILVQFLYLCRNRKTTLQRLYIYNKALYTCKYFTVSFTVRSRIEFGVYEALIFLTFPVILGLQQVALAALIATDSD